MPSSGVQQSKAATVQAVIRDVLTGGRIRAGDLYKAIGLVTSGAICSSRRRLC